MPMTSSMDILPIRWENRRTMPMTSSDPTKAAATMTEDGTLFQYWSAMIMTNPTAIFAPDEIPRTKGPAMGLRKKVCNRKPDTESAPPKIAASRILGSRIFQIILLSTDSSRIRSRMIRMISFAGMDTVPELILTITKTKKRRNSATIIHS